MTDIEAIKRDLAEGFYTRNLEKWKKRSWEKLRILWRQ